jgi:alpha-beta hydrolase superfamily lysophospholipase
MNPASASRFRPIARLLARRYAAIIPTLCLATLAGCAVPQVRTGGEPIQSPALTGDRVVMADGTHLPLEKWLPSGPPRGVVLGLHGFNDYRHAFDSLGSYLAARGFAVYAYDQRGFGGSPTFGYWAGTAQLTADVQTVVGLLEKAHPGLPIHLLGESMGGAVALAALTAQPPLGVEDAVLVAPAVWSRDNMPLLQRGALWLVAHTMPGMRMSWRILDLKPTDDEDALWRFRSDPLVIHESRADSLWGLANLMDQAVAAAPRLEKPLLILYGAHDQIIPRRPMCAFLERLPADLPYRVVIYPRGWHMLTRDLGAGTVMADIAAWLVDRYGALPSGDEVAGRRPAMCP